METFIYPHSDNGIAAVIYAVYSADILNNTFHIFYFSPFFTVMYTFCILSMTNTERSAPINYFLFESFYQREKKKIYVHTAACDQLVNQLHYYYHPPHPVKKPDFSTICAAFNP